MTLTFVYSGLGSLLYEKGSDSVPEVQITLNLGAGQVRQPGFFFRATDYNGLKRLIFVLYHLFCRLPTVYLLVYMSRYASQCCVTVAYVIVFAQIYIFYFFIYM